MNLSFEDLQKVVIPFGKHTGKTLDEIPLTYLDWLVGQPWLRNPLKTRIEQYLAHPLVSKMLDDEVNS